MGGESRGLLDGSRLQARLVGTYQYERSWLSLLEVFNSSEQVLDSFKNSIQGKWSWTYLGIGNGLDVGIDLSFKRIESLNPETTLEIVGKLSF